MNSAAEINRHRGIFNISKSKCKRHDKRGCAGPGIYAKRTSKYSGPTGDARRECTLSKIGNARNSVASLSLTYNNVWVRDYYIAFSNYPPSGDDIDRRSAPTETPQDRNRPAKNFTFSRQPICIFLSLECLICARACTWIVSGHAQPHFGK